MDIARKLNSLTGTVTSRFYRRDKNIWVFGEWFGSRCCDNCLYLANHLAAHHPEIRLYWICKPEADTSLLAPSVTRLPMDTPEATQILRHAGVAVMNQGFVDFSQKGGMDCAGALTVNLWHGVPWKKIGMDGYSAASAIQRLRAAVKCKMKTAKLYLSLSEPFTEILKTSYFVSENRQILAGYPRNTPFYEKDAHARGREAVLSALKKQGQVTDDVKIITYMPTFRDTTEDVFSFFDLAEDPAFTSLLEKYNAVLVEKSHFVSHKRRGNISQSARSRVYALSELGAAQLMTGTDMLITDYSSCFFDFLVTDRPIIHYIYDYDFYSQKDRGLYYPAEDVVCGDTAKDVPRLLRSIDENLSDPAKHAALRQRRRETYLTYESPDSCEQIFRAIRNFQ